MTVEGYKSISNTWNALIPEAGKTFKNLITFAECLGCLSGFGAMALLNIAQVDQYCRNESWDYNCFAVSRDILPSLFLGAAGGCFFGGALAEGVRQLAYRSAHVAQYIFKK